jgi:hypothetical protein
MLPKKFWRNLGRHERLPYPQRGRRGLVFYANDDVVFRNNNATVTVRVVVNGILTRK